MGLEVELVSGPASRGRHACVPLEQLEREIAELAAHADAAVYQMLVRLVEFERREGWGGGFASCAHWLSWRTGIDLGAARERMRVARALERLPAIAEGLRRAALSYSKVRALTRIATPENEADLVEVALRSTAAQVERIVRAWRTVDRHEEAARERERHLSRYLQLVPDGDGMYELKGRLDPEAAATLKRALEAASWELYRGERAGREATAVQRRADAIGLVAECALLGEAIGGTRTSAPDHRLVVVHVDAASLRVDPECADGGPADRGFDRGPADSGFDRSPAEAGFDGGPAEAAGVDRGRGAGAVLEDGTRVSAETSRRLACDAKRVRMEHARDGTVARVGARTRSVSPALRRALDQRDGGCRFPGCASRFCDAHHVRHWADGGETTRENLVLLCRIHHRAVHEDGFGVEIVGGEVRFRRPGGSPLLEVPPSPLVPGGEPGDPLARLIEWEAADGVSIDVGHAHGPSAGERLDLEWAIAVLWRPSGGGGVDAAAALDRVPASMSRRAPMSAA